MSKVVANDYGERHSRMIKALAEAEEEEAKARVEKLAEEIARAKEKEKARLEEIARAKAEAEAKEKARLEEIARAKAKEKEKVRLEEIARAKAKAEAEAKAEARAKEEKDNEEKLSLHMNIVPTIDPRVVVQLCGIDDDTENSDQTIISNSKNTIPTTVTKTTPFLNSRVVPTISDSVNSDLYQNENDLMNSEGEGKVETLQCSQSENVTRPDKLDKIDDKTGIQENSLSDCQEISLKKKGKGREQASIIFKRENRKVFPTESPNATTSISQVKDVKDEIVENQVSTSETFNQTERKDIGMSTVAPNAPIRACLDRASSLPAISSHLEMIPCINNFQSQFLLKKKEEKVEKKKVDDDSVEKLSSSVVQQSRRMQEDNSNNTFKEPKVLGERNQLKEKEKGKEKGRKEEKVKGRKEDKLKSKEGVDNSVIREETFSPSKASLSLKQCVNVIRDQLHIQDTSVGAVIRLALEEFDTPVCNKQSTPLHKTHIIITEGLGMSLNYKLR